MPSGPGPAYQTHSHSRPSFTRSNHTFEAPCLAAYLGRLIMSRSASQGVFFLPGGGWASEYDETYEQGKIEMKVGKRKKD